MGALFYENLDNYQIIGTARQAPEVKHILTILVLFNLILVHKCLGLFLSLYLRKIELFVFGNG